MLTRGVRAVLVAVLLGAFVVAGGPLPERESGTAVAQGPGRDVARNVVFAIHGGAGGIRRGVFTPEQEAEYRATLRQALEKGYEVIQGGGSNIEATEAAVVHLEDSPLFNAGKGAVFTTDGANELDASIMDGSTLDTGAVTGVTHIKNPITAARRLMETSRHVMLAGEGGNLFAMDQGLDIVTQDYFFTQRRWDALVNAKGGRHDFNFGYGTVGAVARDSDGNLAAATSTGGLTNKPVGRIGDSPIIGAGTYANNDTVAVSATGTGEFFIRRVVSYDISALMEYRNMRVDRAARAAIDKVADLGGDGGVIALDGRGNFAMPFNTDGMFRGYVTRSGEFVVKLYGDE